MKRDLKQNRFNSFASNNCGACGAEFLNSDLELITLAGFISPIFLCNSCLNKKPADDYKMAVNILNDIVNIASGKEGTPEERIAAIKKILG